MCVVFGRSHCHGTTIVSTCWLHDEILDLCTKHCELRVCRAMTSVKQSNQTTCCVAYQTRPSDGSRMPTCAPVTQYCHLGDRRDWGSSSHHEFPSGGCAHTRIRDRPESEKIPSSISSRHIHAQLFLRLVRVTLQRSCAQVY